MRKRRQPGIVIDHALDEAKDMLLPSDHVGIVLASNALYYGVERVQAGSPSFE